MNWDVANRNLIAKAIGELYFEEIFTDSIIKEGGENSCILKICDEIIYHFQAFKGIWGDLVIKADTLRRNDGQKPDAARFFKETQHLTKMSDITLANFLEEMHHTLFSDQILLQKQVAVSKLYQLDSSALETLLNGHPKLLLNKGRLGWAPNDLLSFAPENDRETQFLRIAIRKNLLTVNCRQNKSFDEIISADLTESEINYLKKLCNDNNINYYSYFIVPVHAWQWENKIRFFFQKDINCKNIVFLARAGDCYKPHISIRTFSNCQNKQQLDIKLPISILNTSCIRGIPSRYISIASEVSEGMAFILKQDAVFAAANTDCLMDVAAFSYVSPDYSDIQDAPYRYKEFLGAIWRESSLTKLKGNEKCLMTGALSYLDGDGHSLIGTLIEKSKLSIEQWLAHYFNKVVIPLYHLQSQYGIGLVAHGQNTLLKLENNMPSGLIIKDFQGDLRLNQNLPLATRKIFTDKVLNALDYLPSGHIIYDLITGHFVSVLRFISQALYISHSFQEAYFYGLLGSIISAYEKNYPTQSNTPSLLTSKIQRVLLNKVRFEIGYQDSAQRPKPQLGSPLDNPLVNKESIYG
ncbi:aerobactin synthase [Nitrosomonas sp. Nm51]|uniref:IucA/IucC family protein n=1 Tax=Nitrosomonas sp. Nm51 TaxID=133720 RepID=UPI0008C2513B|nr:IucA/IucC family protein [Nitrosomonas sp. Nm51]SER77310.1 aerobactin synthase [Nitrosomonas sp. Nm51]